MRINPPDNQPDNIKNKTEEALATIVIMAIAGLLFFIFY
jgi:hypothetical protein